MDIPALERLVERLRTQDNRATAYPLYVVRERQWVWNVTPEHDGAQKVWLARDGEAIATTLEEVQQDIRAEIADMQEVDVADLPDAEYSPELYGWVETYRASIWQPVTVHFTEAAAEEYISRNRHNLRDPQVYVASQYRCTEWNMVVQALPELVTAQVKLQRIQQLHAAGELDEIAKALG